MTSKSDIDGWLADLQGDDYEKRQNAIQALGRSRDKRAVQPLVQILRSGHRYERQAAVQALGQIGKVDAVDALVEVLSNSDHTLRMHAAEALGKIGSPRAVEPLVNLLNETYHEGMSSRESIRFMLEGGGERRAAIQALRKISDPHATDALIDALDTPGDYDHQEAIYALLAIGEPAIPALIDALNSHNERICEGAAQILAQMDIPSPGVWTDALASPNKHVRNVAVEKIGKLPPSGGNVEQFFQGLNSADERVRHLSMQQLSQLSDTQTIQRLIQLLLAGDKAQKQCAQGALTAIGAPAIAPLIERLDAGHEVNWTLISIGLPVIEPMLKVLHGQDIYARYNAKGIIETVVGKQQRRKGDWQHNSVCSSDLCRITFRSFPPSTRLLLLQAATQREEAMRRDELLQRLEDLGVLESKASDFIRTMFLAGYYACRRCRRDHPVYSPVKRVIAVLDDDAQNHSPTLNNEILSVPWTPQHGMFDFDEVQIRHIAYPYSSMVETFVHLLEEDRDAARPWKQTSGKKIPCRLASNVQLSAADFSRLSPYVFILSPIKA